METIITKGDVAETIITIIVFGFLILLVVLVKKRSQRTPEEIEREDAKKRELQQSSMWGFLKPEIICPHCQVKGHVRTKMVKRKAGISGAKATGAILTLGTSMLLTGLSRKEEVTEAHCGKCGSTWHF